MGVLLSSGAHSNWRGARCVRHLRNSKLCLWVVLSVEGNSVRIFSRCVKKITSAGVVGKDRAAADGQKRRDRHRFQGNRVSFHSRFVPLSYLFQALKLVRSAEGVIDSRIHPSNISARQVLAMLVLGSLRRCQVLLFGHGTHGAFSRSDERGPSAP